MRSLASLVIIARARNKRGKTSGRVQAWSPLPPPPPPLSLSLLSSSFSLHLFLPDTSPLHLFELLVIILHKLGCLSFSFSYFFDFIIVFPIVFCLLVLAFPLLCFFPLSFLLCVLVFWLSFFKTVCLVSPSLLSQNSPFLRGVVSCLCSRLVGASKERDFFFCFLVVFWGSGDSARISGRKLIVREFLGTHFEIL